MLNFKKPSRVIIITAVALVAILIAGFAVNRTSGIELPSANEVQNVTIDQYLDYAQIGEVLITDKGEITQISNSLSGARKR